MAGTSNVRPAPCAKEGLNKSLLVIPAQAGFSTAELVIQPFQQIAEELDPSLRRNDGLFKGSLTPESGAKRYLSIYVLMRPRRVGPDNATPRLVR